MRRDVTHKPIPSTSLRQSLFKGSNISYAKINPAKYNLELYNILDKKNSLHTLYKIDSVQRKDLVLVVNGGMFQEDLRSTRPIYFRRQYLQEGK